MDNRPDSSLSPEQRKRFEEIFKAATERIVSRMDAMAERMDSRTDAMAERIGGRIDRISARLDALPGLNARVNSLSERVGRNALRTIDRPRHYHSASEYYDIFGSSRRRTGRYG